MVQQLIGIAQVAEENKNNQAEQSEPLLDPDEIDPVPAALGGSQKLNAPKLAETSDQGPMVECTDCFNNFYEDETQIYECPSCKVLVCRACNSRVASRAHTHFFNVFGCP